MKKVKLTDAELTLRASKYNRIKHIRHLKGIADMVDKSEGVYKEVRQRAKELLKKGGKNE